MCGARVYIMKSSIKKLPKSQIEMEIEIPSEDLDKFIAEALSHAAEHLHMDGFRKGSVPKNIVEEKVGKENLLAEAADLAVKDAYFKVVKENNLEPISHPEIKILKLAQGNPFSFKLTVAVLPEIDLADYKKVASQIKTKEIPVTDQDVQDSLEYIKKSRAKFSQLDKPAEEKDFIEIEYESPQLGVINQGDKKQKDEFILGQGGFLPGFENNFIGMKAGEEKEFPIKFPESSPRKDLAGKDVKFQVKMLSVKKVEFPEINDDFAKSLGKFENLESLKNNIKEGISQEKKEQARQDRRREILERVAEKSKLDILQSMIDFERENMFKNFREKISQNYKVSFEDYLASVKQDEKSINESFTKEAEKKVKNFLILREIGKKENIQVSEKELEEEVTKTMKYYSKDALAKIDINELKEYTKGVIYNEKVFLKLESITN